MIPVSQERLGLWLLFSITPVSQVKGGSSYDYQIFFPYVQSGAVKSVRRGLARS
ncbi:hypothetical protein PRECH8_20490 [Insulibacter thermoxylanivorax]|uniref:Uncharacterized protein n=1 Tax=Insulibacter thermoxylanivorax TaxID=2749268 RepID=A0A916VGA7_9BACL|nr:hypothetical protein PRECH8_20490 [Insulibacter thermoxylanivorax]